MSVFNRYFREKDVINMFESTFLPVIRITEKIVLHSFLTQVASETFYRWFLSHCDGILELKSLEEEGGQVQHYIRIRTIRGTSCDSRWRNVHLESNGQIAVDQNPVKTKELGIGQWLKGPKKG